MKLISIQYARALAASMIVLLHALDKSSKLFPEATPQWQHFLSLGVDLFFVISGFIMWVTTANRSVSPLQFLKNRLIRIVPLYWAATSVVVIVMLAAPALLQTGRFDLIHVVASYLFVPVTNPGLSDPILIFPVMVVGWSINIEMYFYVIFAALLVFARTPRLILIVLIFIALFLLGVFAGFADGSVAKFYTRPYVLCFALGIGIGELYLSRRARLPLALHGLILAASLTLILLFGLENSGGPLSGMVTMLGLAGLIFVLAMHERDHGVVSMRPLVAIGDASYSIYLLHPLAQAVLVAIWRKLPLPEMPALFVLVQVVVPVLIGLAAYALFEKPVSQFLGRRFK